MLSCHAEMWQRRSQDVNIINPQKEGDSGLQLVLWISLSTQWSLNTQSWPGSLSCHMLAEYYLQLHTCWQQCCSVSNIFCSTYECNTNTNTRTHKYTYKHTQIHKYTPVVLQVIFPAPWLPLSVEPASSPLSWKSPFLYKFIFRDGCCSKNRSYLPSCKSS